MYGKGINDSDYHLDYLDESDNKIKKCPFYRKWVGMLERCYSEKYKLKNPSYNDATVCSDWLSFMNFKFWMEKQDWYDKELDKDLLFENNKIYSPDKCLFISHDVNKFMTERTRFRGDYPLGVDLQGSRFRARCSNLGKGVLYLGMFESPEAAHLAWVKKKSELASILADGQKDIRVANALIKRYVK